MLLSAFISTVVNAIATGTLYTAFLAAYDFSIADVSLLGALPSLAACFCVLSPVFLERFQKRRWLLAGGRLAYYLLQLLGLTLLAIFAKDPTVRLIGFSAILLASNLINSLFSSGYSVWHLNFMPVELRAKYLSYQQITTTVASILSLFLFGFVADALKGTPHEAGVLTALRFVALAFVLVDIFILCLPREFPYPRQENKIRVSNIIRLPLKQKKFMLTMMVVGMWTFSTAFPAASWNYYLLHDIGTGVTILNLFYPFMAVCLLMSPMWRHLIYKFSWFRVFGYCAMVHTASLFLMASISKENYLWVYTIGIFIQAFIGVGLNLSWSNVPFINTPQTDQTYYLSFYTLISSVGTFLGNSAGAWFVRVFPEGGIELFGKTFVTVPCMLLVQIVLYACTITFIFVNLSRLEPNET
ncbi:MAG: hypothetical protein IJO88_01245 [Oscillospiraceae bacterium]|nr:hypothetical protein [Oscillospiraceae bacterium]